jgi:co-chaperonin GroES (HSP10)
MITFRPNSDRILVQRLSVEGLIRLTDAEKSGKGVVLSTGPGKWLENENGDWWRRPVGIKPGDIIRFTGRWDDADGLALSAMLGIPDVALITEGDIWWKESEVSN